MPIGQDSVSDTEECTFHFLLPDGVEGELPHRNGWLTPLAIYFSVYGSIRLAKRKQHDTDGREYLCSF
jgi:hypothetical protein